MAGLSMEYVNDNIINLMECPVCLEYLIPPIHQCKNAHNICSKCKTKLTWCPTCNEVFLESRSIFVEQIAEMLMYPCKNFEVGCSEKYSLKDISLHHSECPHRKYECQFSKASNCTWEGRSFDVLTHAGDAHANYCWMIDDNSVFYDTDIFNGTDDTQLVSAVHEAFYYNFKCDVEKQKMFLALQYIGPKDLAYNYVYEFELCAYGDTETSISLRNRVHKDTENVSDIYDSGRCVVLDFATVKKYIGNEGNMAFNLRVRKALKNEAANGSDDAGEI